MFESMKTEETVEPTDTKTKILRLLNKANDYIWMSTGLNKDFYNDIEVKNAMLASFDKVKQIRILIDGDAQSKKKELSWLFESAKVHKGKIQIKQTEDILHWIISDGKHFRLEKPHELGTIGMNNLFVCDVEPPAISEILMAKFNSWWIVAKTVD
ncbi:MAG: hypothetical protein C3F06_06400 [Candidatus Methanoperedenaceae archaeon]|nr:MAG: hypothetical protein C3F06_06400 [Candidatus Methanoperedenaceae archaeon]